MKRFLFLVAPLLLISCKKETSLETTSTENVANKMAVLDPTDTIVVHKDSVDNTWEEANKAYICGRDTNSDFFVALSYVPENSQNTAKAKWLRDNKQFINYESSAKYISKRHTIPANVSFPELGSGSPFLTYKAIQDSINSDVPDSFKKDRYDDYVKFSISGNDVHVTVIDTFDPGAKCYSIPFLRSIARQNPSIGDNTKFFFGQATVNGKSIMYFKTDALNSKFNITHIPTLPQ